MVALLGGAAALPRPPPGHGLLPRLRAGRRPGGGRRRVGRGERNGEWTGGQQLRRGLTIAGETGTPECGASGSPHLAGLLFCFSQLEMWVEHSSVVLLKPKALALG